MAKKKYTAAPKVQFFVGKGELKPGDTIKITATGEFPCSGETMILRGAQPADAEPVYAFPTRSRCPKCQHLGTRAEKTEGGVQHRRCFRPSCQREDRGRYKVPGTRI